MPHIQVALPETAMRFVEEQVAAGRFASASEYFTSLVEEARAASAKRKLEDLLDEGLAAGPAIEFTSEWWRARKDVLLATLPAKRGI